MTWLIEAGLRSGSLIAVIALGLGVVRVATPQIESCVWRIVLLASLLMPLLQSLGHAAQDATGGAILPLAVESVGKLPIEHLRAFAPTVVERDLHLGFWFWSAYGLVASVLLARIATGLVLGVGLCRRAERLVGATGPARDIRISRKIESPAVFGRTILLPASCVSWSQKSMSAVLAHEQSHLRRHDFFILLLASIHRAVFWFNPAGWWLLRRLALLAEMQSDDASIATLGGPRDYAEILKQIAGRGRGVALSIPMASAQTLDKRLHRMERWRPSSGLSSGRVWSVALLTAGSAVLLAAWAGQPSAAEVGSDHSARTADAFAQRRYEQARPRQAVALDAGKLKHWVGTYRMSPFTAMTISSADGHVYAQITGQERIEVFPDVEGELFYRANPAQLSFTGISVAPASKMILHQDGEEQASSRLTPDAATLLARRFSERLSDNRPQPGSAAALQRALTTEPSDAYMSPELAASMHLRQPTIHEDLRQAGTLQSISFAGVGHGGWDVYDLHYEHAQLRARILLGDDGRIDGLFLEYLP